MSRTPVSIAALILAVALAYALGQGTDMNAFYLQPTRVDAGRADTLRVVSHRYSCGAVYTSKTLQRTGSRIDVRFVAQERPDVACPAIFMPYGPAFGLPALPEGRYDVYATALHPCLVAPQPCEMPEKQERVGILTVGPADKADWFLSPATAQPDRAFALRLLSETYGNCGTRFDHASLTLRGTRLLASFAIMTDMAVVCVVDIRPHGPTFQAGPLPAGRYPVDVIEVPACVYAPQPCPWLPEDETARTVDTLVVAAPVKVIQSRGAPASGGSAAAARPGLIRAGGTLAVPFPGDAAAGAMDMRGRRITLP